jgi:CubicO group peptidase (beta-lactamase class C family)
MSYAEFMQQRLFDPLGMQDTTCWPTAEQDGVMRGRRLVQEYIAFYKKYVPGCEHIELATTGSLVGVRESRRIVGEYELTFDDYLARRQFPDQIAVFNKAVDIHVYDDSEAEYQPSHDPWKGLSRWNSLNRAIPSRFALNTV